MPVTRSDDSCDSRRASSKNATVCSPLVTTHWHRPVPSRSTRNAILPLSRLLYNQPCSVTSCPTWSFNDAIVAIIPAPSILLSILVVTCLTRLRHGRHGFFGLVQIAFLQRRRQLHAAI